MWAIQWLSRVPLYVLYRTRENNKNKAETVLLDTLYAICTANVINLTSSPASPPRPILLFFPSLRCRFCKTSENSTCQRCGLPFTHSVVYWCWAACTIGRPPTIALWACAVGTLNPPRGAGGETYKTQQHHCHCIAREDLAKNIQSHYMFCMQIILSNIFFIEMHVLSTGM